MSVCSREVENAAHSAPRELLTTRRISRDSGGLTAQDVWVRRHDHETTRG